MEEGIERACGRKKLYEGERERKGGGGEGGWRG